MQSVRAQVRNNELELEQAYLMDLRTSERQLQCLLKNLQDFQDAENHKRSVFVRNVHFGCTPEQLQRHFESCGTICEVTIRTNESGRPKGCAIVEFLEVEAVQKALLLHETQLRGRKIMVGPSMSNAAKKVGGKVVAPKLKKPTAARFQPYQLNNYSNFQHLAKNVSLCSSSNSEDTQTLEPTM